MYTYIYIYIYIYMCVCMCVCVCVCVCVCGLMLLSFRGMFPQTTSKQVNHLSSRKRLSTHRYYKFCTKNSRLSIYWCT